MNTCYAEGLLDYQKFTLNDFNSIEPISGRRILEVGGYHNFAVAYSLNNISKEKVIVINPDKGIPPICDEKIEILHIDGCNTPFADESFDTIVGVAVLEHIADLKSFAKEMFRILAPNGKLYLQGRPLWTSNVGHHVYIVDNEMDYRFNGNNPIDDFDHLLLSEAELQAKLIEVKNLPASHAKKITDFVHNCPDLNRFSPKEILEPFSSLPFSDMKTKYLKKNIIAHDKLTELNEISGICLYLKK